MRHPKNSVNSHGSNLPYCIFNFLLGKNILSSKKVVDVLFNLNSISFLTIERNAANSNFIRKIVRTGN
jgi:hypothetical protein